MGTYNYVLKANQDFQDKYNHELWLLLVTAYGSVDSAEQEAIGVFTLT